MDKYSPQRVAVNDLDPLLTRAIEETLLFGKIEELDALIERISGDVRVGDDLRYGLEGLRYFRAHYDAEAPSLSEEDRQKVIRFDADWTMKLIQKLHRHAFGVVREKLA